MKKNNGILEDSIIVERLPISTHQVPRETKQSVQLTDGKKTIPSTTSTPRNRTSSTIIAHTSKSIRQADRIESNNQYDSIINDPLNEIADQSLSSNTIYYPTLAIATDFKYTPNMYGAAIAEIHEELTNRENRIDFLNQVRSLAVGSNIGSLPSNLEACRFALPYDLKLLESMTPLDYLTDYCRLPLRRKNLFNHLFIRYRNINNLFESSYLYSSLLSIHKENLTPAKFRNLCELIQLDDKEYLFKYATYAGILALCERLLYYTYDGYDESEHAYSTKNIIESCDFYGLDRKLEGILISDPMKRLLRAIRYPQPENNHVQDAQ